MSSVFVNGFNYGIERAAASRQLSYAIVEAKRKAEMNNLMVGLKKAIEDVHTENVEAMVEDSELLASCSKAFNTAEEVLGRIERCPMHLYAPPPVYQVYPTSYYQPSPYYQSAPQEFNQGHPMMVPLRPPVLRPIPRFPQPQPEAMVLSDGRRARVIVVPARTMAPIPRPVQVVAPLRREEQYKEPVAPVVNAKKRKISDENGSGSKKKLKMGMKIKNNTFITDYFKAN
ncbi:unnamed protein product [Bursaphelenchus xylophilus]|uniref:(pine wood nematode) hypothetical protein n=1 Tax=Bursaphelenchus xylophilus TaxID=6326 RepID=A0A1I7RNJ1_BURXY|nr:unnamed protein product [Bursaphelenchus xylophilus]CAG9124072.1 unnamed protein product [Bursaphelenchus xylophilus]